jgi:cupin 2 domain-containing protein
MKINNVFESLAEHIENEVFEEIIAGEHVRIERILSQGHTSPDEGWYDQDEHEWVVVLRGKGIIQYEDGSTVELNTGDYLNIPAHKKHRVSWTDPEQVTAWLAVFYK